MPNTFRLQMYEPLGTQLATATAPGTTTTYLCSNADASDIAIGQKVKIYGLFIFSHNLKGNRTTVTNIQVDTPGVGTTTVTFSPAIGSATATGDLMFDPEIVDVTTWISNNMLKIDDILGAYTCTSTTRPTGSHVHEGQIIYERDTQKLYYRDNAAQWILVTDTNRPRGRVGYSIENAAGATISAGNISSTSYAPVTFQQYAGRRYRLFAHYATEYVAGTDGEALAQIHIKAGATVGPSTADGNVVLVRGVGDPLAFTTGAPSHNTAIVRYNATTTGQFTAGLFLQRQTAGDASTIRFSPNCLNGIAIEDIGAQ